MKIIYAGRSADPSEAVAQRLKEKLGKLDKFFKEEPTATVTITRTKERESMKINLMAEGKLFRGEGETNYDKDGRYKNIDICRDSLKRQVIDSKKEYRTNSHKKNAKAKFSDKYNMAREDAPKAEIVEENLLSKKYGYEESYEN